MSSRSLIRCRVSSFVREAGSAEAFRPRFVLTFLLPPFDLLVVVKLVAPLLLTDGDVLATESAGKKCCGKCVQQLPHLFFYVFQDGAVH